LAVRHKQRRRHLLAVVVDVPLPLLTPVPVPAPLPKGFVEFRRLGEKRTRSGEGGEGRTGKRTRMGREEMREE